MLGRMYVLQYTLPSPPSTRTVVIGQRGMKPRSGGTVWAAYTDAVMGSVEAEEDGGKVKVERAELSMRASSGQVVTSICSVPVGSDESK